MNRTAKNFCLSIFLLVFIFFLLWAGFNYYLIPKIILPQVVKRLEQGSQKQPVSVVIDRIEFALHQGFIIKNISFYSNFQGRRTIIVSAESVDLDLAWLELLFKRVHITKFNIDRAELDIIRNKNGEWNFARLQAIDWLAIFQAGDFSFKLNAISISNGSLNYSDQYGSKKPLERKYHSVQLHLSQNSAELYSLLLSGKGGAKGEERVDLKLEYAAKSKTFSGRLKGGTIYLGQYWKHYLSAWLKPWSIKAKNLNIDIKFEYNEKKLSYSGTVEANGAEAIYGKRGVIENAKLRASLAAKRLTLENLSGDLFGKEFEVNGVMQYGRPMALQLQGRLANFIIDGLFSASSPAKAAGRLRATAEASTLELNVKLSDLKHLKGELAVSGNLGIKDSFTYFGRSNKLILPIVSAEVIPQEIDGRIVLAGLLQGDARNKAAWNGRLDLKFRDLNINHVLRNNFDLRLSLQKGLFSAIIPDLSLYNGRVSGVLKMDIEKWGIGLRVHGFDMSLFGKTDPKLVGLKGTLDINFAGMAPWRDLKAITGGGYCKMADASLRSAVIVKVVEEGINTLNKGFKMPDFKSLEGSFSLGGRKITLEDVYAKAPNMDLRIKGVGAFSGQTDFTVGVKFSRFGIIKTVRQVMFPFTIGFDMLVNAIHLRVSGNWPDLKQSTQINTIKWMDVFFNPKVNFDSDKYSLEKIWQ